ncbi:MAG: hypothetical protein AB1921_12340 [Thermodesulfobacteriota bacterium]
MKGALMQAYTALASLKAAEEGCAEISVAGMISETVEPAVSNELALLCNSPMKSIKKNAVVCL